MWLFIAFCPDNLRKRIKAEHGEWNRLIVSISKNATERKNGSRVIINLEGGELKITSCTKMYQCTKMYNAEADTTMDNIVTAPGKKTIHSFFYQIWLPPKKEKMDRLVQWRGRVGMGGKALPGRGEALAGSRMGGRVGSTRCFRTKPTL